MSFIGDSGVCSIVACFICSECGKQYKFNKHLRQHVSKCHHGKLNVIAPRRQRGQSQPLNESRSFVCAECGNTYKFNHHLREHVSKVHPDKLNLIAPLQFNKHLVNESRSFKCAECGNTYKFNKHLRQHVSKAHPGKLNLIAPLLRKQCVICSGKCNCKNIFRLQHGDNGDISFNGNNLGENSVKSSMKKMKKCPYCNFEFSSKNCFMDHLETTHDIIVNIENLQFSSFSRFIQWKEATEETTKTMFVKKRGSFVCTDGTVSHYFVCHYSGEYISKSKGIRRIKQLGSKTIRGVCPSEIKVNQSSDGSCEVVFISTHICQINPSIEQYTGGTVNDNELDDILTQVSTQESLSHQRDMMTARFLELAEEISTSEELEVLKKQLASFEATLIAVRKDSHNVCL